MNLSVHYNLGLTQEHLDFIDVKLNDDNKLFVDSRLIEQNQNPDFNQMRLNLRDYAANLFRAIISRDKKLTSRLLGGLVEPKETRLGYANGSSRGRSIGNKLKPKFEDAIRENLAVLSGSVTSWGDLDLFIDEISCDRISDMTTKIIKGELIKFTQKQCKKHNIPMQKVSQKDLLNLEKIEWETETVELPVHNGLPIIFVPKDFVRREHDASSNLGFFFRYAIKRFVLNDSEITSSLPKNGKNGKVLVKDLRATLSSPKEELSKWVMKYKRLLVDFKSEVRTQDRLKPLTNSEIEEVVYESRMAA